MFNIAMIGPGSISRTYAEALKDSKIVKIRAIAGRDTEKGRAMANEYRLSYYVDQEEMYEKEELDAVLICTPTFTHIHMPVRPSILQSACRAEQRTIWCPMKMFCMCCVFLQQFRNHWRLDFR